MVNKKYVLLILSTMVLFTGCGKKNTENQAPVQEVQEINEESSVDESTIEEAAVENPATDETEEDESENGLTQLVNPLKEVNKEELLAETGITFVDEYITMDPKYFVLTPADKTEKKIAELRFTVGDRELTYRAQPTDKMEAYDMNGLFYEWDEEKDTKVSDCDAKYMKCSEASGLYWLDAENKINYSLSCIGDMDESQLEGCATLVFNPPADDEPPVAPAYDYEGSYTNDEDDNVTFTRNEDGTYTMELQIFRLISSIGNANDVDGAAEFTVQDMNGEDMDGVFYVNQDGTYTMMFTRSNWTYIKDGDVYDGFVRN